MTVVCPTELRPQHPATLFALGCAQAAVGGELVGSGVRTILHPASPFSRCFNRGVEGTSAK